MFSELFRKKIARFLVYVMLFCNVSPAFAMQSVRPDYQINVQQKNVLDDVSKTMMPALMVEAYKLTEQVVSGVATGIYQAVCNQMIMSAFVAQLFDAALMLGEYASFVDIAGLGRVRVDENNSIVLDATTSLDPTKAVSFSTDRSVIIDSLRCDNVAVTAPNITIRGKAFIKSLNVSLSEENGLLAIDAGSTLTTESAVIDGMIHNYGTIYFTGNSGLISNESLLFNHGTINGDNFALENIGEFINEGNIRGASIGLHSDFLQNYGTIGGTESILDFMVHKSLINNNDIFGKKAKIVLTSDEKGFVNKGSMNIADTELQISGFFRNEGTSELGTLTGFVSKLSNKGKLESNYGSLAIDTGENRHLLKLGSLTTTGDFFNYFTDDHSCMQVEFLLGAGKFFNRSAFSVFGAGVFGIREFYNQNAEFIARYGCLSFGNTVRFVSSIDKIVNEGSLVADTMSFDDTDTVVTNAPTAVIKTTHEMKGRVKSVDNLGGLFSEHSVISLMFDTFVHRGKLLADKGVSFTGRLLRNYSDLSLHSSRIDRIFNGESITDDIDDAFFSGVEKAITATASGIATMPIAQRKKAISDILQKARTMNMMQEEIAKIQEYLDVLNAVVTPSYLPTYHLEQVHGWNGHYSLWNKFATHPKTGTKTVVQQLELRSNAQAYQVTANIAEANNQAVSKNAKLEAAYNQKLATAESTPFPLAELSKLISVYNKRSIPKTSANLWMYFGSNIGRLENTGHVQFIKGLHSIDTYMGTAESEFLLPKLDDITLPSTGIQPLQITEPATPDISQTSDTIEDPDSVTKVIEKKIEGAWKNK